MRYIKSNDRVKLAVYDLKPAKYDRTIVMVHGWPLSAKMYEYQTPMLLGSGYRVVTMDIRGFGNSDAPAEGYTYEQLATDLYHVIRDLDLDDFVLLGFSMGGAIVTKYMRSYNQHGVSKLCLCSAAVPSYCQTERNPYGASVEDTNRLIEMGHYDRPALNKYFGSIFFEQTHSAPYLEWNQRVCDDASGIGEMKCLELLRDGDLFDDLKYITVPTGIFHGKEDKICSFNMTQIMQEQIHNTQLFPFERAGHGAYYDDLDEFNRMLIEFLEKE